MQSKNLAEHVVRSRFVCSHLPGNSYSVYLFHDFCKHFTDSRLKKSLSVKLCLNGHFSSRDQTENLKSCQDKNILHLYARSKGSLTNVKVLACIRISVVHSHMK